MTYSDLVTSLYLAEATKVVPKGGGSGNPARSTTGKTSTLLEGSQALGSGNRQIPDSQPHSVISHMWRHQPCSLTRFSLSHCLACLGHLKLRPHSWLSRSLLPGLVPSSPRPQETRLPWWATVSCQVSVGWEPKGRIFRAPSARSWIWINMAGLAFQPTCQGSLPSLGGGAQLTTFPPTFCRE